ncbi:hypothetical protein [Mycobacterium heckeshornense]|uniref:hypothetical protein n=1 Tax=Mycobacterium heckeshornense TaxID=110505 RepID=UPI0006622547|nr:hypothetical protein [Mycobacterium heckeshornense]KMV23350.1 hypothetical protein ACT16_06685 [Mycobacterium heckeshornense]
MHVRETALLRLVLVLWGELRRHTNPKELERLEQDIREAGLGWALGNLDHHDDDLLTVDQLAHELGYSQSTIRDWPTRYGLQTVAGRYRWGDVKKMLSTRRTGRHHP